MSTTASTSSDTLKRSTAQNATKSSQGSKRTKRYHGAPTGLLTIRIDAAHPDRSVRLVDTLVIDPQLVLTAPIVSSFSSSANGAISSNGSYDQSYMSQIHHVIGNGTISTDLNVDSGLDATSYNIVDAIHKFSNDMAGQIVADYEVNGTQRVTKHFNGRLSLISKTLFVQKVAGQIEEPLMKHFFPGKVHEVNNHTVSPSNKVTKVALKVRLQNTVIMDEFYYDWSVTGINPVVLAKNITNDLKVHSIKAKATLPDETPAFITAEVTRQLNENDRVEFTINAKETQDQKNMPIGEIKTKEWLRSVDAKEVFAAEYKVLTECHP